MNASDASAPLDQIKDQLTEVLQSTTDPTVRANRLTELLHGLCPGASLIACLLTGGGRRSVSALDAAGKPAPEWLDQLSRDGRPHEEMGPAWVELLESEEESAVVESLSAPGAWHGLAAVRLPRRSAKAPPAATALRLAARSLGLLLTLEACRQEQQELQRLANAGELAGVVAHEFANFLNVLLLHVSLLEYQLPASHRADLVELRRQGHAAGDLVREFQEHRHGPSPLPSAVDVNETVIGLVPDLRRDFPALSVRLDLASRLPALHGSRADVRRLLHFLLSNAARASHDKGQVSVHTESSANRVLVQVEDSGEGVADEDLTYYFDPLYPSREGVDVLELAACKSLVRRLGGSLQAQGGPGGVRVTVEFADRKSVV